MNRVIFVTGVFDLFHWGHINFLRRAKNFGGYLIVGIHSDRDVWQYKGQLPVMSLQERVIVVTACRHVDNVIIISFTKTLSEAFYKKYNIDLHVQAVNKEDNEDWYELPRKLGIFKRIPYTEGISTSEILKRIKERNDKTV